MTALQRKCGKEAPDGAGFAGVVSIGFSLQAPSNSSPLLIATASSLVYRAARLLRGTLASFAPSQSPAAALICCCDAFLTQAQITA